ncbi:MAG: PTS sugar transporter subunit IIA [Atopobiaceae bacterium]|nr:PTS sugar transporter subunit IIA [Atopobiaceae bacterium]
MIEASDIRLGLAPVSREQCIRDSGAFLVERGCVSEPYVDAMVERDRLTSVRIGMGIAIPHGTNEAKEAVEKTGVVLQQYPEGVDFDGEKAQLVFGIAGRGGGASRGPRQHLSHPRGRGSPREDEDDQ